jgi:hypothetical protein
VADKFDPYREAQVVEIDTVWPEELEHVDRAERARVEPLLHADPAACAGLEYVRVHTGFCRKITVSQADLERVGAAAGS